MSHSGSVCSFPENEIKMKTHQTSSTLGLPTCLSPLYRQLMWMRTADCPIKLLNQKKHNPKTFCTPNAGGTGSTPGHGTKILHATQGSQKKKKKEILK